MDKELEQKMNELAEARAFKKSNAHTLRTEPAWHYSIEDFIAGFTACYNLMQAEREKVEKLDQFLCEKVCYDDCGFDPEVESKETLVAIFKARDLEARELLNQIRKPLAKFKGEK